MAAGIAIAAIFLAISTAVTLTILYKAHKDLTKQKGNHHMPEEQAYNAVVREDRGSLLVELNDAQNHTLERLSVLVDRLNNVSENAVEGKALAGSLPGSNHLAARVSTQHEINAKINNIIGGLVL